MSVSTFPMSALAASIPRDVLGSVSCAAIASNATTTVDLTTCRKLDQVVGGTATKTGSGASTWGYQVSALSAGGENIPCTAFTATSQAATLSATVYNTITWYPVEGAVEYIVYRSTAATSPATTGSIFRVGSETLSVVDTGVAIIKALIPVADTSYFGTQNSVNHVWLVNDSLVDLYVYMPHGSSSTIAATVANAHLTATIADNIFTKRCVVKAGYFAQWDFTQGRRWVCLRAASGTATAKMIVA